MINILEGLLESPHPWVRLGAMLDLEGRPPDDPEVLAARAGSLADARVAALLDDVADWPWPPITNHKQAKHPLHKAVLLTELGLTVADPRGRRLADRLLEPQGEDGALLSRIQVPKAFGGTGEPGWDWMACDAPQVARVLVGLGLGDDPRVQRALDHLERLVGDDGWPCASSLKMSGPGRKDDPCPYANLVALAALSGSAGHRESTACRAGTEMLLGHWQQRRERKMRMFGIGTDFAKPKFPMVWYDVVHVLDVLSRFPWVHDDARYQEMWAMLNSAADGSGSYTPRSVWMAFKGFDFAQKKEPSHTLDWIVARIRQRGSGG